jgi:beta-fructofuranosidase
MHRVRTVLSLWMGLMSVAAPALAGQSSEELARATASLQQAALRAEQDPNRPTYHFHAPAQWMNDPNGPIHYRGYYHLFYQLNPFGDTWGHMHWGHARSRDLIHWQHLPVALGPSPDLGEEHVFSGCAVVNGKGQPMIFYTSIASNQPAELHAAQWAAVGDRDLITWQKLAGNPVLSERVHGATRVYDWRDPFIFQDRGVTYMVLGGNLNHREGGQAVVNLYRARNQLLTEWEYLGVLFKPPDPKVANIECPNFFKLGDSWVLVISPHAPVEYFVGEFDTASFQFKSHHYTALDFGGSFYAPNSLLDGKGRRLLWGWIKGFPEGRGWNGCLSLPRVLSLNEQGELVQKPAPELKKLRADHFQLSDVELDESARELTGLKGDCLELYADIDLSQAELIQLELRRSADGARSIPIRFNGTELEVAGTKTPFCLLPGETTLKLDIFLDRSVLEVFANNRACFTRVIEPDPSDLGVGLSAAGGRARVRSLHAWKMRPLTFEDSASRRRP